MRTLYDLLGARPDDNVAGLRNAFRKVMASNSALNAEHPDAQEDAPERFRQLVEAYDTLRNAGRRAAYDRLLELEGGQVYARLKRAVSYGVHNVVLDVICVAGLVVVLVGGHELFASRTPVEAIDSTAHGPAEHRSDEIAVDLPAGPGIADAGQPREKFERRPALEIDNAFAAPVDQDPGQSDEVQFSSRQRDRGVRKASSSGFAKPDDESERRAPSTRNFNMHDTKTPKMKITGKPRLEAKSQARNHAPVKQDLPGNAQASLEAAKTSTCSAPQACSNEPPVFGVGF